jgi:hypothetical protein
MVNLSKIKYNRAFIIGNVNGDYHKLIDILYSQNFTKNDILISTGDFTFKDNLKSIDTLLFFMNNKNTVGLLGKNEFDLLQLLREQKINELPLWVRNYPDMQEIEQYLINLPTIVQLSKDYFIVNRGIEPNKDIKSQDPEVFYTITNYDKNSRYYQNSDKLDWYFFNDYKVIFSGLDAKSIEVPAGYCLYSNMEQDKPLKCLIYSKSVEGFTIVESTGNLLNSTPIKEAAIGDLEGYEKFDTNNLPKRKININKDKLNKTLNNSNNIIKREKALLNKPPRIIEKNPYLNMDYKNKQQQKDIDKSKQQVGIKERERLPKSLYDTPVVTDKDINITPEQEEVTRNISDNVSEESIQRLMDTVNKGIPVVTKDTSEVPSLSPENVTPKEDKEEVVDEKGEVKVVPKEDYPRYEKNIPPQYISDRTETVLPNGTVISVDISISAIYYLYSLGYREAIWELHETHVKKDVCDKLSGRSFQLYGIIGNAKSFNGHVPAAIFTFSHPGCKCKYEVKKQSNYLNIPDNAPGLPMNVSQKILNEYKQRMFEILPDSFTVSAETIAPDEPFRVAIINDLMDRIKIAKVENWTDIIKPMQIIKSDIVDIGLGMRHPIHEGDIGFILKENENKYQVYSYEYHRIFTVPKDNIKVVDLKKTDKKPKKGQFVITEDDMLGLLYKIDEEDNMIVYIPEIESTVIVNKLQILDFF